MTTVTNITELEHHLRRMADELLTNRAVLERYAIQATEAMQAGVLQSMSSGSHDWTQSGDLKWAIQADPGGFKFNKRTLSLGFGELSHMNQVRRATQRATFLLQMKHKADGAKRASRKDVWVNLTLKAEKQLPEWIIAEFGRSGSSVTAGKVPKGFMVNYTPRPDKQFLVGPSGRTLGGLRKQIYFMASRKRALDFMPRTRLRTHSGIEEGRIFRKGLASSKNRIFNIMGDGIGASLRDFAAKNGGTVV